ncbi:type II CAAX endopeptidase family protein [Bacillus sp. B15-48]|uniref:CPBP family intramembrane glutamic endopeptidase n=1 Tax=Bacillus sp. B15-48 TaxID=1548601 RepID=UPI00193EE6B2|nr:type II CAAX endopeptidase family protein [Bacillus sp. B15-48]MBM4764330.1 CPBP family intramembrane metalloprotease [Bacillus sp. B15-48]
MKKIITDWRLIFGYLLAHPLIFFSFDERKVFWYLFTATMLILISYAIIHEEFEINQSLWNDILFGLLTGVGLFLVFWLGNLLIHLFKLPLGGQVSRLFNQLSPDTIWHYLILIIILAPGEEIFWRGFIQKRILRYTGVWTSIVLSTLLYASVQLYSGQFILVIAALVGGIVWSALYAWKRSIRLVIVSHIAFDLLLFALLPLY